MKKSMLIANLAVISMNLLGMNPLDNNNPIGNHPGYTLTPASSPNRNSTNNDDYIHRLESDVQQCIKGELTRNQRNALILHMYQQIITQNRIIESNHKDKLLRNSQFASDINKKDNEINNPYNQQDISQTENLDLENRIKQYEKCCSDSESSISSRNSSSTFQPSDTEHINSCFDILVQAALNNDRIAESNPYESDNSERSESNEEENINQNTPIESGKDSTTHVNLENNSDVEYRYELTNNLENSDEEYIEPHANKTSSKKRKLPSFEHTFVKSKKQANNIDLEKILQDIPKNRKLNAIEQENLSKKYEISASYCLKVINSKRNWFHLSNSDRNTFIKKLRNPKNKKNLQLKTVGNLFLNVDVMIKLINKDKVNNFSQEQNYAGLDTHRMNARIWKILIDNALNKPSSPQSRT